MGDPKFSRKKYDTPSHPWEGERITEENEMLKKFGLKNKRELWKAHSMLKNFRGQARSLVARSRYGDMQAAKETKWLLNKLVNMGLLESNTNLDDVLTLDVEKVLNRRLQTVAYHKGLAQTPKQARQLIVHGHIAIKGATVTIPSFFVRKDEEEFITYHQRSPLDNDMHPARPKPDMVTPDVVPTSEPKTAPKKNKKETKAKQAEPETKPEPAKKEEAKTEESTNSSSHQEKARDEPEKPPKDAAKPEAKPEVKDAPKAEKPAEKDAPKGEKAPEAKKDDKASVTKPAGEPKPAEAPKKKEGDK
jgi:small subunit ribosomal protein S4